MKVIMREFTDHMLKPQESRLYPMQTRTTFVQHQIQTISKVDHAADETREKGEDIIERTPQPARD
jgi:hypothetical protein